MPVAQTMIKNHPHQQIYHQNGTDIKHSPVTSLLIFILSLSFPLSLSLSLSLNLRCKFSRIFRSFSAFFFLERLLFLRFFSSSSRDTRSSIGGTAIGGFVSNCDRRAVMDGYGVKSGAMAAMSRGTRKTNIYGVKYLLV